MGKLYIFRGKAATGKSVITDLVSLEFKICILRKDDVYDMFSEKNLDHTTKNKLSYDILAKIINTNLKTDCEIIIDIALANSLHMSEFLSRIDLQESYVKSFLCICSNEDEWRKRIKKRINNPTANQLFKTVDDAIRHYKRYDLVPMKDDIVLDSSEELLDIMEKVRSEL